MRNAETMRFVFCAGRRAAVRAGNRGGIAVDVMLLFSGRIFNGDDIGILGF